MAKDPRKHQKKLQRQKAKDRARKKEIAKQNPRDMAGALRRATNAPIVHCCTPDVLFDQGMSNVLISRELNAGSVAYAIFLVDMYCLGVKDVASGITSRSDYDWRVYTKMMRDYQIVKLEPPAARKLIEGAVEFASEAGFSPHRDYRKAKPIFGDIDVNECSDEFTYGKDGKPFFFAGPHDSATRCREIVNTLTNRFGADGFDYVIHTSDLAGMPAGGTVHSLDDLSESEEIFDDYES